MSTFSKYNSITYCHFPSTKYHIESENIDYLRIDLGMVERSNGLLHNSDIDNVRSLSLEEKSATIY
jgi:hypothetical protein